jgi:uncharacterized protein
MAIPVDPPEVLEAITLPLVERIRQLIPGIVAIYAYGSRVRGIQHPASDLDLALLLPGHEEVSPLVLAQLQGDLEAMAGFPVEISVLSLSTQVVHCKEVVAGGEPVFVADRRAVDEFEMRVLSSYARLCEDRMPVVKAYTGVGNGRRPPE